MVQSACMRRGKELFRNEDSADLYVGHGALHQRRRAEAGTCTCEVCPASGAPHEPSIDKPHQMVRCTAPVSGALCVSRGSDGACLVADGAYPVACVSLCLVRCHSLLACCEVSMLPHEVLSLDMLDADS